MIGHYCKSAVARLAGAPVTTLANILTLALGLLAVITASGVVSYWRSSDREIAPIDRVVVITTAIQGDGRDDARISLHTPPAFARYLREDVPQLEKVARFRGSGEVLVDTGEQTAVLRGAQVEPEFLDIFKLPFVAGDPKTALRQSSGVLLTQQAAQRLFGNASPLGRKLVLAKQRPVIVSGVLAPIPQPSHFGVGYEKFDYLSVMTPDAPGATENWRNLSLWTYALLPSRSSFGADDLNRELVRLVQHRLPPQQRAGSQDALQGFSLRAVGVGEIPERRLNEVLFGAGSQVSVVVVLFALGVLVLFVACLNYANLATAQALRRSGEIAMRKVLGARRFGILMQSWIEAGISTILALGLTASVLWFSTPAIVAQMDIDVFGALVRDQAVLAVVGGIAVAATLAAGLLPAVMISGVSPSEVLRLRKTRQGSNALTQFLIGLQFAAASSLLIAVFIISEQNSYLRGLASRPSGDPVVLLQSESQSGVPIERLRRELAYYPQLKAVDEASQRPWSPGEFTLRPTRFRVPGAVGPESVMLGIGYDYFGVYDQKLLAGRHFDRQRDPGVSRLFSPRRDNPARGVDPIVIDNTASVRLGFSSPQNAIGQLLHLANGASFEVIGVVEDQPHQLQSGSDGGTLYSLNANAAGNSPAIRIAAADIDGGLAAIKRVWSSLSPNMSLDLKFEREIFEQTFNPFARVGRVFEILSLLALSISAIGLFGMAVNVIQRRRHEIGVRKVLGASAIRITTLLVSDFSKPVIVANVLAWPLAWYAAQAYLGVFMRRIDIGPLPFFLSLGASLLVAWLVVGGQAVHAATLRPGKVLREA